MDVETSVVFYFYCLVHTRTILKFGGLKAIRNAAPILLGITIRDAICLGLWKMCGIITNHITLGFAY